MLEFVASAPGYATKLPYVVSFDLSCRKSVRVNFQGGNHEKNFDRCRSLRGRAALAVGRAKSRPGRKQPFNALSRKFNETRVEPGVRQEYQLKLQQIGKSTSCVDPTGKGGAGGFECRMATPQQIESAKAQAAQLERDFDALVKELAGAT